MIGSAFVEVHANTSKFKSEASSGVGATIKGLAKAAAGIFVADEAFRGFKSVITDAAQTQKATELVNRTFGAAAGSAKKFADTAATSFGESKQAALTFEGSFGNLLLNLGVGRRKAEEMSQKLTGLSGDLSSIFPVSAEEAQGKLQAALSGQVRGLKSLGIVIQQTGIQAEALKLHLIAPTKDAPKIKADLDRMTTAHAKYQEELKKYGPLSAKTKAAQDAYNLSSEALAKEEAGKVPKLTASQKAMASYGLIVDQTRKYHDAYKQDAGNLINVQRTLTAEWTNMQDEIGAKLLPYIARLGTWLGQELPAAGAFLVSSTQEVIHGFQDVAPTIQTYMIAPIQGLVGALGGLGNTVKYAVIGFAAFKVAVFAIEGAVAAYKALQAAILIARNAQIALDVAMETNPIGLVAAGIAAAVVGLTSAFGLLGNQESGLALATDKAKDAMQALGDAIQRVHDLRSTRNQLRSEIPQAQLDVQGAILARQQAALTVEMDKGSHASSIQQRQDELALTQAILSARDARRRLFDIENKLTLNGIEAGKARVLERQRVDQFAASVNNLTTKTRASTLQAEQAGHAVRGQASATEFATLKAKAARDAVTEWTAKVAALAAAQTKGGPIVQHNAGLLEQYAKSIKGVPTQQEINFILHNTDAKANLADIVARLQAKDAKTATAVFHLDKKPFDKVFGDLQSTMPAKARGLGVSVVQGIRDGIAASTSILAAPITLGIDNAIAQAKAHAHIKSPSRLTADEIGGPLGQGIVVGLRESLAGLSGELYAPVARAVSQRLPVVAPQPRSAAGGRADASTMTSAWRDQTAVLERIHAAVSKPQTKTVTVSVSNPDPAETARLVANRIALASRS